MTYHANSNFNNKKIPTQILYIYIFDHQKKI